MRPLELLAPARTIEIGRQAILHGADAVYIGAQSFGARKDAGNSVDDIARLADFVHEYSARIYATVNTIIYDRELRHVEQLIKELYHVGVDAIIVQDMGILRLDLPPIALHASTQCHTEDVAHARFLQETGFSQIVLARELGIEEISEICNSVDVAVETFVHGALCVSYSGRCHAGAVCSGRSANRGECPQLCRLPYTLRDAAGRVMAEGKHLLSLKDLNTIDSLQELIDAGVSSFKIEGRLKDADYVKNVVAAYSRRLDEIISQRGGDLKRSSVGRSEIVFEPKLDKSFNRGFTDFFLHAERPFGIISPDTPKSLGEMISDVASLNNNDGISYFDEDGNYRGAKINRVVGNRLIFNKELRLPKNAVIHRTFDSQFSKLLQGETSERRIWMSVVLTESGCIAFDERGAEVMLPWGMAFEKAEKPQTYRRYFEKLGATHFYLKDFENRLSADLFIPASRLSEMRRSLCEALDGNARAIYRYDYRRHENKEARYPESKLDFRANVANTLARRFYAEHGAVAEEMAVEICGHDKGEERVVMTCRHCILRELGKCRRTGERLRQPLTIESGNIKFYLRFDCEKCRMMLLAGGNIVLNKFLL